MSKRRLLILCLALFLLIALIPYRVAGYTGLRWNPVDDYYYDTGPHRYYWRVDSWTIPPVEIGVVSSIMTRHILLGIGSSVGESRDDLSRTYLSIHPELETYWKFQRGFFSQYRDPLYGEADILAFRQWLCFNGLPAEVIEYVEKVQGQRFEVFLGLGRQFGRVGPLKSNRIILAINPRNILQPSRREIWVAWTSRF